jgi:hemoglobin
MRRIAIATCLLATASVAIADAAPGAGADATVPTEAADATTPAPSAAPATEAASAPAATATRSLYQRLGGYDALAAVTDDFLERMMADPDIGYFFVGHSTDSLARIRQLIVDQLCAATGGPCKYVGRDMKTVHAGLGISEAEFGTAAKRLQETLDRFKVPPPEQREVFALVTSLKPDIVQPATP